MKPVKKVVRKATGGDVKAPKTTPTKKPVEIDKVAAMRDAMSAVQSMGNRGDADFVSPKTIERRIESSYEDPQSYVSHADDDVLRDIVRETKGGGARGRSARAELEFRDNRMAKYADPTKLVTSPRQDAPEKKSSMAKKYATPSAAKPVVAKKGGLMAVKPTLKSVKPTKPAKVATKPTVRRTGRGK